MIVKLTRRQWLELPLEYKVSQGTKRFVLANGRMVPVQWCQRPQDSDLKGGVDTAANGQ